MVLVASVSGVLEGFAIMKFGDDDAHLLLLAVQPKSRRSGIGKALLHWLEKSCRTAGMNRVRLEVRAANRDARLFYERMGYQYVSRMPAYYENREAAVVMTRYLTRQR